MEITPLRAMRPFRYIYTIRVRVSRIWRPRFRKTENYDGLHYVLVDQDGDSIHAFINEEQHNDMTQEVELGHLYDIHRFSTHQADRTYKVVENEMVIHFTGSTVFVKIDEITPPIPQHSFRLIELEDLGNQTNGNEILADIYGYIQIVKPPHDQPLRSRKKVETKCEVTVQNLRRQTLKITLWGDIARSFDVETLQRSAPPVLAVFTSIIPGEYGGQVVASNSNHTCVFFNPTIPVTDVYMIEFSKTGDKVTIDGQISNYQTTRRVGQPNRVTVSELNALNPLDYQNKTVYCNASIRKFSQNGWWYRSCSTTACYRMLHKDEEAENRHFCPLHGLQEPKQSYLVNMVVEDEQNQATLTLQGRQAEQLFNSTCQKLLEKRFYQTEQSLPDEIVDTIGQTYEFEIKIKREGGFTVSSISANTASTTVTPASPQSERKRTNECGWPTFSNNEPDKKSRRETEEEASSSSSMEQSKTKID